VTNIKRKLKHFQAMYGSDSD